MVRVELFTSRLDLRCRGRSLSPSSPLETEGLGLMRVGGTFGPASVDVNRRFTLKTPPDGSMSVMAI